MASRFYTKGLLEVLKGTFDFQDTLKVMLIKSGYTFDPDINVVDTGNNDAYDPSYYECNATNYTGGYGGAGRKTATITLSKVDVDDRVKMVFTDLTWNNLGQTVPNTICGAILLYETGGADTSAIPLIYFDFTPAETDGGNFQIIWASTGQILVQV
jgi:hypothetical protein